MKLDGYLLAVDPSTKCGFAVLRSDGSLVQSGVVRLHPRAHQGDGGRFVNLVDHLNSLVRVFPAIASLSYEVPGRLQFHYGGESHNASAAQYLALYGIVAHCESWAERAEVHYRGFGPSEVKKLATGRGNANKAEVIAAMAARFELDAALLDDNEADALAIGIAGLVGLDCIPAAEPPPKKPRPPRPPRAKASRPSGAAAAQLVDENSKRARVLGEFYGDPT